MGQFATVLDNQSLLEKTQVRAEQERRVRTITDKIRRGTDREAILRMAREEISQLLGATKSTVRLGTQDQLLSRLKRQATQAGEVLSNGTDSVEESEV